MRFCCSPRKAAASSRSLSRAGRPKVSWMALAESAAKSACGSAASRRAAMDRARCIGQSAFDMSRLWSAVLVASRCATLWNPGGASKRERNSSGELRCLRTKADGTGLEPSSAGPPDFGFHSPDSVNSVSRSCSPSSRSGRKRHSRRLPGSTSSLRGEDFTSELWR